VVGFAGLSSCGGGSIFGHFRSPEEQERVESEEGNPA